MKKTLLVATILSAIATSNALASSALDIFNTASGTVVTYDNASGAYPIVSAILSQPGTVGTHTYTSWSFLAADSTGSIDMYGSLPGAYTPQVGDGISLTGTYSPYHQIPEINAISAITQMSTGNALPATNAYSVADLTASTNISQNVAGHLIEVTNVTLYTDAGATMPVSGNFADGNTTLYAKDGNGNILEVYVWVTSYSTCAAFVGTPIPTGHVTVLGFVSQFSTFPVEMTPIQFIPLGPSISYTNILSNLVRPGDAPTNTTFTEYALRPGETLTVNANAYDADGSNVTFSASSTAGGWSSASGSGLNVNDTFTFTPSAGNAGNAYTATFSAWTSRGTNTTTWSIYVPTAEEQNVVISEFLANPTSDTNSPYFNPLHRPPPGSTNAFSDDEFIEIVNANSSSYDFVGWSFDDAVTVRHTFFYNTPINSSNTAVIYGGGTGASIPGYSEPFNPAPSSSVLNNGGDTIRLYNAAGKLVDRVVYTSATDFNGISWTRYPTLNDGFVQHLSVVATNASPGLQPDQQPYTSPAVISQPPTISGIANQTIPQDTSTGPLALTVSDPVTPANNLTLYGYSSNPQVIPYGNIAFGGSGSNRTVTVTPAAGVSGISTIYLTVGNAALRSASTSFVVSVVSTNVGADLFCDDFSYPDGSIITNSSLMWTSHSGTAGQMQVSGGKLQVTGNQSEDVNRLIPGQPYTAGTSVTLWAGFTVNFSALPISGGDYFAHFKDNATGYQCRLFASTENAAPGKFRLSIGNALATPGAEFPQDLSLNTTYGVVMNYNLATAQSELWVNPSTAASPAVQDITSASPITVTSLAFRESSGIGTMQIDNLCVGTGFSVVVPVVTPSPIPLNITRSGSNVILTWSDPAFSLLTGTNVTLVTNRLTGVTSPYTNSIGTTARFYKLVSP